MDKPASSYQPPDHEKLSGGSINQDTEKNSTNPAYENTTQAEISKQPNVQEPSQLERRATFGVPNISGLKKSKHHSSIMSRYNRASLLAWLQIIVALAVIGVTASLFGRAIRTETGRRKSIFTKIHGFAAIAVGLSLGIGSLNTLAFIIRPWPRNYSTYTPNVFYVTMAGVMSTLWLVAAAMTLYCISNGRDWVNDKTLPASSTKDYSRNEVADMLWPRLVATAALSMVALLSGLGQIYQIVRLFIGEFSEEEQSEAKQTLFKMTHR